LIEIENRGDDLRNKERKEGKKKKRNF